MLRNIRIILATLFFIGITLLLCSPADFPWLAWLAKLQFLPAVLALNLVVILAIVLLTCLLGRVYCSVVCPLGILQDIIAAFGKKTKKNPKIPYTYSPAKNTLRYVVLLLFVVMLISGVTEFATLLAPYGSYGRMVQSIIRPTLIVGLVALVSFLVIAVLSWCNGRTYCNTICPVGTTLGLLSRFSLFRPVIDASKCNGCKSCARNCKASCINPDEHSIDMSRCVVCMDCINKCRQGAIKYTLRTKASSSVSQDCQNGKSCEDGSKRQFLTVAGIMAAGYAYAQKGKVDGGLAEIEDKVAPHRATPVVPPGALSLKHFHQHCTACQLCVSACPNKVLRPSGNIMTLMQPESSYELGFCRPECTKCSEVCPSGAIRPITKIDKKEIQIGHAVVHRKSCVKLESGDACGSCARHCPVGAISMVNNRHGHLIPVVDEAKCIGCGACEYLCPSRPVSAIRVEGHEIHKKL